LYRIFLDKKKCGIDEIKMALETEYDVVMNHKKIRRILRKNNIISSIRATKPYRKMMKAGTWIPLLPFIPRMALMIKRRQQRNTIDSINKLLNLMMTMILRMWNFHQLVFT